MGCFAQTQQHAFGRGAFRGLGLNQTVSGNKQSDEEVRQLMKAQA